MSNHNVMISVVKKKIKYSKQSLDVSRGDTITWKVDAKDGLPFAIIIKSFVSPLEWGTAVTAKGKKTIVGTVRGDAEPGYYHYGTSVWDGTDLLADDPEIIVKPPKGRS